MNDPLRKCATDGCDGLVYDANVAHCQACINERRIQVAGKLDRRRLRNNKRHIGRKKRRRDRYR